VAEHPVGDLDFKISQVTPPVKRNESEGEE
jgi:hypothetical protein